LYFLRWCFDLSRWKSYQKRFALYMIIMVVGAFTIDPDFAWVGAGLIWLDFTVIMIQDSWNSFCREQKDMIKTLKERGDK